MSSFHSVVCVSAGDPSSTLPPSPWIPDVENSKVTKKKDINKVHRNIEYCLDDLGLFCAYEVYCMHWSIIVVKN